MPRRPLMAAKDRPPTVDDRAHRAYEMAVAGMTTTQIGQALGLSYAAANYLVKRGAGNRAVEYETLREQKAQIQHDRLEAIVAACYQFAMAGSVDHMDRILKAIQEENKLLGLYEQESTINVRVAAYLAPVLQASLAEAAQALEEDRALAMDSSLPILPPVTPSLPPTNGHLPAPSPEAANPSPPEPI